MQLSKNELHVQRKWVIFCVPFALGLCSVCVLSATCFSKAAFNFTCVWLFHGGCPSRLFATPPHPLPSSHVMSKRMEFLFFGTPQRYSQCSSWFLSRLCALRVQGGRWRCSSRSVRRFFCISQAKTSGSFSAKYAGDHRNKNGGCNAEIDELVGRTTFSSMVTGLPLNLFPSSGLFRAPYNKDPQKAHTES